VRLRIIGCICLLALAGGCAQTRAGRAPEPELAVPVESRAPETIGRSVDGRRIEAVTLGRGETRVYLLCGIHGDERSGGENFDFLLEWLSEPGRLVGLTLRLVRDVNPDGSARGTRGNANGVDLNRNWPAANFQADPSRGPHPLSEPETLAVHADLIDFDPEVVLVFHCARGGPFVNFDGPAAEQAEVFAQAARSMDPRWHSVAEMGYHTPGSLGSFVGVDRGVPILTIEFARGQDAESAWSALRAGLAALLRELALARP